MTATHPDAPAAPFAVNQIVHRSNDRFEHDMAVCAKWKVPIVITSLGARTELNDAVHALGRDHAARHHRRPLRAQGGRERRRRADRGRRRRRRPCRALVAVRAGPRNPHLVRRAADPVGRDRHRRRDPRRAGDGRRPRLYRLAVHRHARSQQHRRIQAGDRRGQRGGHRLHRPVHRRSRQLSALVDRRLGARSRRARGRAASTR